MTSKMTSQAQFQPSGLKCQHRGDWGIMIQQDQGLRISLYVCDDKVWNDDI